jgi:hypothetical protein
LDLFLDCFLICSQIFIEYSLKEIAAQRVSQIVAGYEDANDCDKLRDDTILKMSVGRSPVTGKPIASQPTMTRFENSPKVRGLYYISYAFVVSFIETYKSMHSIVIIVYFRVARMKNCTTSTVPWRKPGLPHNSCKQFSD